MDPAEDGPVSAARPPHHSRAVRLALILGAVGFIAFFLLLPLVAVFAEALAKGFATYGAALVDPDALSAIKLTLLVAAISVPLNVAFGLCAAWAVAKFDFRGKSVLCTL